jgi:hypothetical protein
MIWHIFRKDLRISWKPALGAAILQWIATALIVKAGVFRGSPSLVAALKSSFARCDAAFDALTDANALDLVGPAGAKEKVARAGMLAYVNTHNNEGYGSMAVYLRLKGIVPPSSQRAGQK